MGSVSRIIMDAQGEPTKIVHPTDDIELNQLCFTGPIQADVPRFDYDLSNGKRGLLVLIQSKLTQSRPVLAAVLGKRVNLIDAGIALQTDVDAREALVDQFGDTPTNPQRALLAIAAARIVQDVSDIQTIRNDIQTLITQL